VTENETSRLTSALNPKDRKLLIDLLAAAFKRTKVDQAFALDPYVLALQVWGELEHTLERVGVKHQPSDVFVVECGLGSRVCSYDRFSRCLKASTTRYQSPEITPGITTPGNT
jgi:ABC-type taurine transport system substrate-binding protein